MAGRQLPVRERVLLFGPGKALVGILTEPPGGAAAPRLGVILLNAGILHRVGPNRLHVRLARELAATGVAVLRFDLSGLGDSPRRQDQLPFSRAVVEEVRDAVELLCGSRGVGSCVLAGLCSGADAALRVAALDDRVVGAALIEAYAAPTAGHLVHSYREKLLSPVSWWRLISGRSELWSTLRSRRGGAGGRGGDAEESRNEALASALVPSGEELRGQLQALVDRRTRLCLVYAESSPAYYNYRTLLERQLAPARGSGLVRVEALAGTDHVFTPLAAQDRLVEVLVSWCASLAEARRLADVLPQ